MSQELLHPSSSGRRRNVPTDYYEITEGLDEDDVNRIKFARIHSACEREGYDGLFEAAIAYSELYQQDGEHFIQNGGFQRFVESFVHPFTAHPGVRGRPKTLEKDARLALTKPFERIYAREWRNITSDNTFKVALDKYSPEQIESFSLSQMHDRFEDHAPCLMSLMHTLASPPKESPPHDLDAHTKKLRTRVVVALCVIATQATQHFNLLQGFLAYTMYSFSVPKRIVSVFNRLGICSSFTSLSRALKSSGEKMKARLHSWGSIDEAMWYSFDNLTIQANVRDERIHNRSSLMQQVCGFAVRPHDSKRRPRFSRSDRNRHAVRDLNVRDFLPSETDYRTLEKAFRGMISDVITSFAKSNDRKVKMEQFDMPRLHPLDPTKKPEIITLPVLPKNEANIAEMIDILNVYTKRTGIPESAILNKVIHFRGDFLTVRNIRYVPSVSDSSDMLQTCDLPPKEMPTSCKIGTYRSHRGTVSYGDSGIGNVLQYTSRRIYGHLIIAALDIRPRTRQTESMGRQTRSRQELPCVFVIMGFDGRRVYYWYHRGAGRLHVNLYLYR
jgi:hypothetical protein